MNRFITIFAAGLCLAAIAARAARADCFPNELRQSIANPSPAADDNFGHSAAVSGDVAVVGAPEDDTGATNAGTAYVFNATTGALVATLSNPDPTVNDYFGGSVAIFNNTAVVGRLSASDAGPAYVFNATTGALAATLSNPTPALGGQFGSSVAISGNVAVVGARSDAPGGATLAGSAYIFSCVPPPPTPTPTATPYDGRIYGDFDNSGCTNLQDFLFLLDYWQAVSPIGGDPLGIPDFLALLDNWQLGPVCP